MPKHFLIVSISLILTTSCFAQKASVSDWIADLDFYHNTLETKHIDLYHTISKKEFAANIQQIKNRLHRLDYFQVVVEIMKLTHKIGAGKSDGHTAVPLWGVKTHTYPLKLFEFEYGIRVVEIKKEYAYLMGMQLKKIDNIPIDVVYGKVAELTPFTENKQSSMDRVCRFMNVSEILLALNITKRKDSAQFTFVDDHGREKSVVLKALTKEENDKLEYANLSFNHPNLIEQDGGTVKNIGYAHLGDGKTVYIKLQGYPPTEEDTHALSEKMVHHIRQNNSENIVVDLRNNYGGDFFKGLILAGWLNSIDNIDWKSGIYVLTNRATYSAAVVNAVQFRELLNAKIVGEPTGGNPNGYQDMGQFHLPHSNLTVTYSKRLFRFQDKNSEGVVPDVIIEPTWQDYKRGVDKVIEWVVDDINERRIAAKN